MWSQRKALQLAAVVPHAQPVQAGHHELHATWVDYFTSISHQYRQVYQVDASQIPGGWVCDIGATLPIDVKASKEEGRGTVNTPTGQEGKNVSVGVMSND